MFKIKVQDLSIYKSEKKKPYLVRYELIPDISKGVRNEIRHEVQFSNLKTAHSFCSELSDYFSDCFLFLELIYNKVKQLEVNVNQTKKYLRVDFNALESSRVKLIHSSHSEAYAHKHIQCFKDFINQIKYLLFAVSKDFESIANRLFKMLLDFEESFINTYRCGLILSEKNQLKLFL